jgi:putative transcriptional regulator
VYTDRGQVRRIISARRAKKRARDMATVRKTLDEIRAAKSKINWEKLRAAKDADIARQIAQDPDTAPEITVDALIAPKNLRRRLNMTQEEFADALGIPVATLRNWEQGRHGIDPAARSLLILIARDPEETLATLAAARAA